MKTTKKTTRRKTSAKPSTALAVRRQQPEQLANVKDFDESAHAQTGTVIDQFSRVAMKPGMDVNKLNALIDASVRVMKITAQQKFDEAFAAMQGEMPIITKRGLVKVSDKDTGELVRATPYARDVDIAIAVRPILAKHGFSLRHSNTMKDGLLTVTGILSHRAGHREEDQFQTAADASGKKNPIQSWGSARAYGKRYTTIALLNISSEDDDDDGFAAGDNGQQQQQTFHNTPGKRTAPPARAQGPSDDLPITKGSREKPGQVERLWVIIRNSGRDEQSIRDFLFTRYGYTSTRDIKRKHYEAICNAIESKDALPAGAREPGQEG